MKAFENLMSEKKIKKVKETLMSGNFKNFAELARNINVSKQFVGQIAKELGIKPNHSTKKSLNIKTENREYVYFIQSKNNGRIKIGITTNPDERFKNMQTSSSEELHLLTMMKGNSEIERKIHTRFVKYNHHGEWFEPSPELSAFISAIQILKDFI